MEKKLTIYGVLFIVVILQYSCKSTQSACDCMEQFNYFHQDGGLLKIDENKLGKCIDEFKDPNANYYPEDLKSAERNAQKECNK